MLQTLYVHNFRCLENFTLDTKELSSFLLIGKNGSGKSTISRVLEVFQSIGRGINRIRDIVSENDFSRGRSNVPIRFVMEILLEDTLYQYELALELPENFKELRIAEERLSVAGKPIYSRKQAEVLIHTPHKEVSFFVDWHLVALPIIQEQSASDPLHIFKTWLSRMIILHRCRVLLPVSQAVKHYFQHETVQISENGFPDYSAVILPPICMLTNISENSCLICRISRMNISAKTQRT
ncbi:AAA domain-containing protein, putative AbiEii toxin, Type IV TA system [Candidatus Electrothrix marina]|uniref:AAA domain-containing protein, putative AbiEii toxin, Type IV TA system n=1 Tax=Candidatus Electrothrix marina TaxID=1859130 RepID=A0A444JB11_9BACT|nr:AAA domain-containing protein, putative AbiEii toxin, Type IV TA system [Candidatus Electrothrix marina]